MARLSYRENIQKQMQTMLQELSKLQASKHILSGHKAWNVFDRKRECLEKDLKDSIEEYQRILRYTFKSPVRFTTQVS